MLITTAVCLPLGAVLGIKFNIKMIMHAIVAAAVVFSFLALAGAETIGSALSNTIVAAIALQVGYFVSLMMLALGLVPTGKSTETIAASDADAESALTDLGKKV
jgi:hypothetical protein